MDRAHCMISRSTISVHNHSSRLYSLPFKKQPRKEHVSSHSTNAGPLGTPIGVIRLYSPNGESSRLVSVGMETTVEQLCDQLKTQSIFLQIGNHYSRSLPPSSHPLRVLVQLLQTMGYSSESECVSVGSQPFLRHLFAFFDGRPYKSNSSNEVLRSKAWVRKGKVMKRWIRADCLLYNHTIRISKQGEEDDIAELGGSRISRYTTSKGETLSIDTSSSLFCILFDDPSSLHTWLAASQMSELSSRCDLSDRGLLLVPDHLFSVKGRRILTHLNLRRNSLLYRSHNTNNSGPLIGWVEDIGRLSNLQHLDLSSNRLGCFPSSLSQLPHLTRLSLAGNYIQSLPIDIRLLVNLTSLDLSNNWLSQLPSQLSECSHLSFLNLAFNRFHQIPSVLSLLPHLSSWLLAGNEIKEVDVPPEWIHRVEKLDLRRNVLSHCFRLPSPTGDRLQELDVRDNIDLSSIQLTNLPSLKILHADRLQLTHLHLNGSSLTHINASHNLLDGIVVMPPPSSLVSLVLSHNRLSSLPDWLSEITSLQYIDVSHNQLLHLPPRLLSCPSLRSISASCNRLHSLPQLIDNSLESIDIHSNQLRFLPPNFFYGTKKLRDLNVSGNILECLPSPPPSHRLRSLRLSFNNLDESVVPIVCSFRSLVLLHISHNRIHFFDDSTLRELRLLEEINVSHNQLASLSLALPSLPSLRILRAHSNSIESLPTLSTSSSLQIVDVSNNHIVHIDSSRCIGKSLRQLDLTCNAHLSLPPSTHSAIHRPLSLVNLRQSQIPFSFGFSESTGSKNKLCIQQLRPSPNSHSCLFGMVDGGSNEEITKHVIKSLRESSDSIAKGDELSRCILQSHSTLGTLGERLGASLLLCLVLPSRISLSSSGSIRVSIISLRSPPSSPFSSPSPSPHSLTLTHLIPSLQIDDNEYSRVRHASSILDENNSIDGVTPYPRQIGLSYLFPAVIPSPQTVSLQLTKDNRYLLIASHSFWDTVSDDIILSIVSTESNPHIAAKSLQDAAEAFGCTGNVSIILIRVTPSISIDSSSENIEVAREENKLKEIEERLDQISQVISRIGVSPPLPPYPSSPHSLATPHSLASPSPPMPSPPPLPSVPPPHYSSSSIHHIGPVGSLRSSLSLFPLPYRSPLSHLPPSSSHSLIPSTSPSSSVPPPDPSRARFDAARNAVQDSLRLPPS